MAKDRIDRAELADKLLKGVTSAEDPLRAMAEMIADFMMEAEVTAKIGAEAHERSAERTTYRNRFRDGAGIRGWARWRSRCRSCGKAAMCQASSNTASAVSRRW